MSELDSNTTLLGKEIPYEGKYCPELLTPIPRQASRAKLFGQGALPFTGRDIWTAYELSWLNAKGKPMVAIAEFDFPFDSQAIIESKSFKYYLNSFNQTRIENRELLVSRITHDLSKACGGDVKTTLFNVDTYPARMFVQPPGVCVDELDIEIDHYQAEASYLKCDKNNQVEKEKLYSHLLKSNCPVTGQPDWATICIEYSGPKIDHTAFLRYVVSFREHQDFHENCVEKVFGDIHQYCEPHYLTVFARYTRRGGLDINPYRTNGHNVFPSIRLARQ